MTSRAVTFLIASATLYFFANQTQVGWLYVMAAALLGVVLVSWQFNRRMLHQLGAERWLEGEANLRPREGDEARLALTMQQGRTRSDAQLEVQANNPLAPPGERDQRFFVAQLGAGQHLSVTQDFVIHRRGVYSAPPVQIRTRAPFGFVKRKRSLPATLDEVVFPELRMLPRLALLDRQFSPEVHQRRAGVGSEVMGVRAYRSGDSPRHIHWRTVARTGRLATKEFAEESQPGLTLALDLYAHPYPDYADKRNPFEWSVKAAASIGDYALRRGYPLHVAWDSDALAVPAGSLSDDALGQVLARVAPAGRQPLADMLSARTHQRFLAVLVPWPDGETMRSLPGTLSLLHGQGLRTLVVVIDAATFPGGGPPGERLAGTLRGAGLPDVRVLRFGEDWVPVLAEMATGRNQRATRPAQS